MRRVVAITGASAGIGRATALRLARDGASVAICARRRDRLDAVAAEISRAGGTALPIVADVTREADMQAFVGQTVDPFGQLDVMMCNAGFGIYGAIDEITPEQMRRADGRQLPRHLSRRARGAAGVPPAARTATSSSSRRSSASAACRTWARMRRRSSRRSGSPNACAPSSPGTGIHVSVVYPVSTDTEFFEVMSARSGTRRAPTDRGRRADRSPTRSRARSSVRCRRSTRTACREALAWSNADRARLLRSAREEVGDGNRFA